MSNYPVDSTDFRFLLPEIIWLEPEHFKQTREISDRVNGENCQWQTYLNVLALLAFKEWLNERMSEPSLAIELSNHKASKCFPYLGVGDFKLCIIATENLLDEIVNIPKNLIEEPESAAHFYVAIEVFEEQAQVIVKGFLPYDRLLNYRARVNLQLSKEDCYQIPMSELDPELNHLLFYLHYLESSAIVLSPTSVKYAKDKLQGYLKETRTKLSQWLEGFEDKGWQTIEALVNSEASLALSTRNALKLSSQDVSKKAQKGKIINLGMQLKEQTVTLLVTVAPETENKLGILVRLLPTGGKKFLPANLKLTLSSKTGKNLQEVQSGTQDNYIQLKPFKGELGKHFSIEVSLSDVSIKEDFEL